MKIIRIVYLSLLLPLFTLPAFAQDFGKGCVLDHTLYSQVPLAPPMLVSRGDADMPARVSLRKYAPTPQNQGAYGTCVGWAISYAARTILMAEQNQWEMQALINENALSPYFIYEQAKSAGDVFCQEGTSLYNALEIIRGIGTVSFHEFPGQCGQLVTPQLEQKAQNHKIKEYRRLFEAEATHKILAIKRSIAEARPVVVGIQCCTESFLNAKGEDYWQLQATDNANPEGGHALTVIGYDDNKNGGAVELMNSWGTIWGDDGFIWMSYKDFEKYCFEAYEMVVEKEEKPFSIIGRVQFELTSMKNMKVRYKEQNRFRYYEADRSYHSGALFKILVQNTNPVYIYAFGTDLTGATYTVFPSKNNVSPYFNYAKNTMALPSENEYIQLDNTLGMDYFCMLYSKKEVDLESILQGFRQAEGDIISKIQQALQTYMPKDSQMYYYQGGEIGFEGKLKENEIAPLVIAIPHIE